MVKNHVYSIAKFCAWRVSVAIPVVTLNHIRGDETLTENRGQIGLRNMWGNQPANRETNDLGFVLHHSVNMSIVESASESTDIK